jgi:hypothetical protein
MPEGAADRAENIPVARRSDPRLPEASRKLGPSPSLSCHLDLLKERNI